MELTSGHIYQIEMQTEFKVTGEGGSLLRSLRALFGFHTYFDDGKVVVYWEGPANENGAVKELVATQVATRENDGSGSFLPHAPLNLPVAVKLG